MSARGKSPVRCEVCGDRVRHEAAVEVVGRKLSGVPRVLCGDRKCRREWRETGATRAANWPENRWRGLVRERAW